jgi:hypothetical protein
MKALGGLRMQGWVKEMQRMFWGSVFVGLMLALSSCDFRDDEVPAAWKNLIKTEGQHFLIPKAWITTPEGRITHNLKLPDSVPKPVPFDFEKARGPWYWPASSSEVALAYFEHLCRTEAGEWTFKKLGKVDGLYFARPEANLPTELFDDVYGPEAPWVEKEFQWMGEGIRPRGMQFVNPPFSNFLYVEEPRRDVYWQKDLSQPYLRFFGYTASRVDIPANVIVLRELAPMKMIGLDRPTAKYAYTWRGITRPQDRKFRIAGGELIIYDRESHEIISVSRTFQIFRTSSKKPHEATWRVSPVCVRGPGSRMNHLNEYAKSILRAD